MTSGFQADTAAVAQTSQKAAESADTIIGYFGRMRGDTETVLSVCKGSMFNSVTEELTKLQAQRDKLLPRLQQLSQQLKQGGQGMDSQSDTAATAVRNVGASSLSTPINFA